MQISITYFQIKEYENEMCIEFEIYQQSDK